MVVVILLMLMLMLLILVMSLFRIGLLQSCSGPCLVGCSMLLGHNGVHVELACRGVVGHEQNVTGGIFLLLLEKASQDSGFCFGSCGSWLHVFFFLNTELSLEGTEWFCTVRIANCNGTERNPPTSSLLLSPARATDGCKITVGWFF